MTREIVSVNLNGTRFPATIVSKKDFDFMRQDGDIGSMDYDQAVKNGDIFFGWSTWMEQDGYAPGESIAFDFENGSGTYTYQGKIAGSFVSADTYLVIPEGVYRSMNPRGTAYGYLWVDCDKKDVTSVEQSLNTLISNTSHIKMDTYHAQLQYAELAARMMKLGCYLFIAVVGLIGFMNMPLRYNNDKQKKPLFSRGLSVCRLLFNSFSKLKIDENYKEKRRLFY